MKKSHAQLLAGLAVSAVFLYIALRPVNMGDLAGAMKAFNWLWALPFIAVNLLSMWLRAWRWKYLLEPAGKFTTGRLFSPMMAGFAVNSLFPARLGEFARAYILGKRESVPVSGVFATVVVERIFDSIVLLAMLPIALASIKIDPSFEITFGNFPAITHEHLTRLSRNLAIACGMLVFAVFLLMLPPVQRLFEAVVSRTPLLPQRFRDFIVRLFQQFVAGLDSLKSARAWIAVIGLSVAVWVVIGWAHVVLSWGFAGMDMSLMQGIVIMVITCIAIAVPAAPGFWGLMQLGIVAGMYLTGVERDYARALGFAFVFHALQYFPVVAIGMACLWKEHISLSDVSHASEESETVE